MYSGVYDDIHPRALPEDLDLYSVDAQKYPELAKIKDYILNVTVKKGDCLYVPELYYY